MPDDHELDQLATLRQMAGLQAEVCYHNVDRTLATWTRTALSLIVFGIVVDRFGLLLAHNHPAHVGTWLAPNPASTLAGIVLVALGIFIVVTASIRHQAYRSIWNRIHRRPWHHGPFLAFTFAVMVATFGIAILAVLLVFVW